MAAILPFGTEFSAPAPDAPSPPPLPVAPNGRRYESALRDGGWAIWSGLILAPLVGVDFLGDGQGGPWGISSLAWEHFVSFIPHHSYAIEPRPGLSVLPSGRKAAGCVVLHDGAYSWYEGGSNHTLSSFLANENLPDVHLSSHSKLRGKLFVCGGLLLIEI